MNSRLQAVVVWLVASNVEVPAAVAQAPSQGSCTRASPCTLPYVGSARSRVAQEKKMAARMANAPATEHNINAGDEYLALIRKWMNDEKEGFSQWCALAKLAEPKTGRPLTSEQVFILTGQPDEESPLTQGGVEGKLWSWTADGPFSGSVRFGIEFARPAGSNAPWSLIGCAWCLAGGVVAPRGCVDLPWRP